jgi:pimeloyl-ACP methyl ester carboxylesterase
VVNPSRLYLLPGLGGTRLYEDRDRTQLVWNDRRQLTFGGFYKLALAPDGLTPRPPNGKEMYPGDPLPEIYGSPWSEVKADQRLTGWTILPWGYDWRLDLNNTGAALGLEILTNVKDSAPCTLVGHSNGGAVARYAWSWLKGMGREGLIRRIITLGTPHQGSHSALGAFLAILSWLNVMVIQQQSLTTFIIDPAIVSGDPSYSRQKIAQLTQQWPGFYDLLPNPLGTAFVSDTLLPRIFDANNYPPWNRMLQSQLDYVRRVLMPAAIAPEHIPPPWVLTTIGGRGYDTWARVRYSPLKDTLDALGTIPDGDGTVTLASALVEGSKQLVYQATHTDLVAATVSGGQLVSEVLDPRGPPDPVPPQLVAQDVYPVTTGMPPFVRFVPSGGTAGPALVSSGPDP